MITLSSPGDKTIRAQIAESISLIASNDFPKQWHDLIDVRGYGIRSFAALRNHLDENAAGVTIDLGKAAGGSGNVNTVTLLDADLADLDRYDFIFLA